MSESSDTTVPSEAHFEQSPGSMLKAAREKAGISLQAMAQTLYITNDKLRALEADEYDKLPSRVFIQGYLRKYAASVGLSGDEIVDRFNGYTNAVVETEQQLVPDYYAAPPASKPPQWIMPAVVFGLATVIILLVLVFTGNDESAIPDTPPGGVSESSIEQALIEERVEALANEFESQVVGEPVSTSASDNSDVSETSELTNVTEIGETAAPLEVGQSNAMQAGELSTVLLTFTEDCWVKINEVDGKVLFSATATPSSPVRVEGTPPFEVMLGNSRAASLVYNGEIFPIQPIPGRNTIKFRLGEE